MKIVKRTEQINAKTSTGKTKHWVGLVYEENNKFYTGSEYWTDDGKHTFSTPTEIIQKNVGKKNETSLEEQAILEINSAFKLKLDKGYGTQNDSAGIILPMLAHDYNKRGHDIEFPAIGQPKYDGCRCMFDNEKGPMSRQGKPFIKEIFEHLEFDTKGYIFDGELMIEGIPFEETIAAIKKYRSISKDLVYLIYDIVIPDLAFEKRYELIKKIVPKNNKLKIAPNFLLKNETEIVSLHNKFVDEGYEGLIIRNKQGLYKIGHRSKDLQKFKMFVDDEFKITGAEEGTGKFKGCIKYICVTKDNESFEAIPDGPIETKKELYTNFLKNPELFIGKLLTVRYQGLTKRGVPRFPVAKTIRDYE